MAKWGAIFAAKAAVTSIGGALAAALALELVMLAKEAMPLFEAAIKGAEVAVDVIVKPLSDA